MTINRQLVVEMSCMGIQKMRCINNLSLNCLQNILVYIGLVSCEVDNRHMQHSCLTVSAHYLRYCIVLKLRHCLAIIHY